MQQLCTIIKQRNKPKALQMFNPLFTASHKNTKVFGFLLKRELVVSYFSNGSKTEVAERQSQRAGHTL